MAAVTLLVAARADFDAAFDWYAARSESAALGFDEEVQACFERIVSDPQRFARLDAIHRQARVSRYPYRIVFQVAGDRITVVAIAHHSRRPGYWRPEAEVRDAES